MGLIEVARWLKGNGCTKLIKRTVTEFSISGTSVEAGEFKINIGSISNKVQNLVPATENAIILDETQYLLCDEISKMKDGDKFKNICKAMRLQIIIGFAQLRGILASLAQVQTDDLKMKLTEWIDQMGNLNKQAMLALQEKGGMISKGGSKIDTSIIMKYQGITETEMNKAINEL